MLRVQLSGVLVSLSLIACGGASTEEDRGGQKDGRDIAAIAIGDTSTCTMSASGHVECDGRNVGIEDATSISVGHNHSCAVRVGGHVACFGGNEHGQLGDGTSVSREQPADIGGLVDVVGVSAGFNRTCAWTTAGDALCWGTSEYDPHKSIETPRDNLAPQKLEVANVKSIALGAFHACALIEGGTVKCWGANYFGQLGDGTEIARDTAAPAHVINVKQLAAGTHHTCALLDAGIVQCWGADIVGQLGEASTTPGKHRTEPTDIPGLRRVQSIVAASDHTCVLIEGRTAPRCWGYNDVGQVSPGKPYIVRPATIPSGVDDVKSVASGPNRTCAVRVDGAVKCWGEI
jgi:alpha-tubulin suppressor-like RCC1 family protein